VIISFLISLRPTHEQLLHLILNLLNIILLHLTTIIINNNNLFMEVIIFVVMEIEVDEVDIMDATWFNVKYAPSLAMLHPTAIIVLIPITRGFLYGPRPPFYTPYYTHRMLSQIQFYMTIANHSHSRSPTTTHVPIQ